MGLSSSPQPPIPIMRSYNFIDLINIVLTNLKLNFQKPEKVRFIHFRKLSECIYMMNKQFLRTPKVRKRIKELPGGSLIYNLIRSVGFLVVL